MGSRLGYVHKLFAFPKWLKRIGCAYARAADVIWWPSNTDPRSLVTTAVIIKAVSLCYTFVTLCVTAWVFDDYFLLGDSFKRI